MMYYPAGQWKHLRIPDEIEVASLRFVLRAQAATGHHADRLHRFHAESATAAGHEHYRTHDCLKTPTIF